MTIIQQPTLFDIDILAQLDIKERHAEIFSPIDFSAILNLFQKDSRIGPPISINYEATIRAIICWYIEGIPTIKALVKRLNEDLNFKLSFRLSIF